MKLKAILFAAASFLVLVNAAANVATLSPQPTEDMAIIAPAHVVEASSSLKHIASLSARNLSDSCKLNCNISWNKCVRDCDGGSFCEHKCNCILFSDPKQLCRLRGFVAAPDNCPAHLPSGAETPVMNSCLICLAAVNTCVGKCGGGKSCEASCKCSLKETNTHCAECASIHCDSSFEGIDIQSNNDESAKDAQDTVFNVEVVDKRAPPPQNPCVNCQYSVKACKKKCPTPGACDDACNCFHKRTNRNCKDCKLSCDCGHTCPRLRLRQRDVHEDIHGTDDEVAGAGWDPAHPYFPSLCYMCDLMIKECKNRCVTPGACDGACNCYHKMNTDNCKGCERGIACTCGHTCPRLALRQREILEVEALG